MYSLFIHTHIYIYKPMKKIEVYCFHWPCHLSFLLTTARAAELLKTKQTSNQTKQNNKNPATKTPNKKTSDKQTNIYRAGNGIFIIVLCNFV